MLPCNSVTRNIITIIFIQHVYPRSIIFKTIRKISSDREMSIFQKIDRISIVCRLEHFTRQSNHIVKCFVLSTKLECSATVPRQFELSRYVNSIETRESFTYPASIDAQSVGWRSTPEFIPIDSLAFRYRARFMHDCGFDLKTDLDF